MSKNHLKFCRVLNYIDHLLNLTSTTTVWASISAFASLVVIPMRIKSSSIGLKSSAIIAGIKRHKSIIKKNKKKCGKIVLLTKSKLNTTEVLISKALIDTNISNDEFILINNVLKKF